MGDFIAFNALESNYRSNYVTSFRLCDVMTLHLSALSWRQSFFIRFYMTFINESLYLDVKISIPLI